MIPCEIRSLIKASGLKQWQVAQAAGISEFTLIRWMRSPLTVEKEEIITSAINSLTKKE